MTVAVTAILRAVAGLVWQVGDLAGWVCTRCYRAAGRLNGYGYEAEKRKGGG